MLKPVSLRSGKDKGSKTKKSCCIGLSSMLTDAICNLQCKKYVPRHKNSLEIFVVISSYRVSSTSPYYKLKNVFILLLHVLLRSLVV